MFQYSPAIGWRVWQPLVKVFAQVLNLRSPDKKLHLIICDNIYGFDAVLRYLYDTALAKDQLMTSPLILSLFRFDSDSVKCSGYDLSALTSGYAS